MWSSDDKKEDCWSHTKRHVETYFYLDKLLVCVSLGACVHCPRDRYISFFPFTQTTPFSSIEWSRMEQTKYHFASLLPPSSVYCVLKYLKLFEMLVRLFFARKRIVSPFRRFVPYNIIVVVCHFHCTILNNKIYTFLLPALSIQFSSCPSLLPTLLQNLLSLFSLVDRMWLSFSTLSRLSSIPLCSLVQLTQHL